MDEFAALFNKYKSNHERKTLFADPEKKAPNKKVGDKKVGNKKAVVKHHPKPKALRESKTIFDHPNGKAQTWILIGKSMRGKSYFTRWLLYDRFDHAGWKFGLIFTPSGYNQEYDYLPEKRIIKDYNEEVLKKYVNNLKSMLERGEVVPPNFVLFDDLVGILTQNTPFFTNFVTTARHTNTNIIICVQYIAKGVSTTLREQVSYALMWKSKNMRTIEYLYKEFGTLFDSVDDFQQYFWENTSEPYSCICYLEREDELAKNYIPIKAPKDLPKRKLDF